MQGSTWDSGLRYWVDVGASMEDRGCKKREGVDECDSGVFSLGHVESEFDLLVR